MASPAYRDTRFPCPIMRRSVAESFGPGVTHGTSMRPAGAKLKEKMFAAGTNPTPPGTSQAILRPEGLATTHTDWRYTSSTLPSVSMLGCSTLQGQRGGGPRMASTGLEWRCRTTSDFGPARIAGGGLMHTTASEMRPAGVSTAHKSEVVLRGWHGYKEIVRRLDHPRYESDKNQLLASCPDLRLLASV
eukprot:TRINITY_DN30135_c0_g1_i1.p1 TRINITY_DN30135_c0_g1~~TRINITY_DN30135_c0_g1_i1.p1  ORF type:complete len:189 (-),score=13.65 TRINITY_DN30135_c0_g1_i1:153-719(-)